MKKVWAVYLDLTLLGVSERHQLRVWVAYGALLGAVRHQGFVPWDDDLDVWMPRPDYERLIEIGKKEFNDPYYLQTTLNDEDYYNAFARLRNSNTTGILVSHHNKCNNGIFMDIFPLDGEPASNTKFKRRYKWIKINNTIAHAYTYNINPSPIARMTHAILRLPFIPYDKNKAFAYTDRMSRAFRWSESEDVGMTAFSLYQWTSNRFKKDWFDETVYLPFERLSVPVPAGYKELLTTIYGGYMKFPPMEDRGQWHRFILEPDIPYKQYCQENYGIQYD